MKNRLKHVPISPPDKKPKTSIKKATNDFNNLLKKKTGSLNGDSDSGRGSNPDLRNKDPAVMHIRGNLMDDDSGEEENSEQDDSEEEQKQVQDIQTELLKIKEIKRWDLA